MTSIPRVSEDPAARRARARRVAVNAEADCAAQAGRADLLLRAALHRLAAGDVALARAQVDVLLGRAGDDPEYAPLWLVRQAMELKARIEGCGDGDPPAEQHAVCRR